MDPALLTTLADLLQHGGSIGMLVAVFIAGRVYKSGTEALETLKEIRELLSTTGAATKATGQRIESGIAAVHNDVRSLPLAILRARLKTQ